MALSKLDPVALILGQIQRPTDEALRSRFAEISDELLCTQYNEYLDSHKNYWLQNAKDTLPKWARNTGNATLLSDYMNDPDSPLTYEQKRYLGQVLQSTSIAGTQQKLGNVSMDIGRRPLETTEPQIGVALDGTEKVILRDVHQKDYQTSRNGCWSCFFQVLASSRGLDITQEQIRNYRPNISKAEAEEAIEETDKAYNADTFNNAIDMGDSILSFLPNTMLSELSVTAYNELIAKETGLSAEEYANAAMQKIKKALIHALKDEKSPVGITNGKHFLTIVGIDGNKILYKNSQEETADQASADVTHEKTIQELFGDVLQGKIRDRKGLDFTYASEIKLSKDGKTLFGVPSDFVTVSAQGKVSPQPHGIRLPPSSRTRRTRSTAWASRSPVWDVWRTPCRSRRSAIRRPMA